MSDPNISPDGKWIWNGTEWIPNAPSIPPLSPSTPLPMPSSPNLPIIISSNAPKAYSFMWMKEVSAKKYTITFSIFTALIIITTVISIYGHAVRNDWPINNSTLVAIAIWVIFVIDAIIFYSKCNKQKY